jgi:hypothetical protein
MKYNTANRDNINISSHVEIRTNQAIILIFKSYQMHEK